MSLLAHVALLARKAHREIEARVVYKVKRVILELKVKKVNKELKAIPGQQAHKAHKVSQVVQLVHLVIHREIWLLTIPVDKQQSAPA
jgi:hypothetical protein